MSRVSCVVAAVLALAALSAGCRNEKKESTTTTTAANPPATQTSRTTPSTPEEPAATATSTAHAEPRGPAVTWKGVGLSTPESVIYDTAQDLYLVSNIEGKPLAKDGKGFISRLSPEGEVEKLRWIDGGKNKVTLNAPKGLALANGTLYVADLDTVRMFDAKSGAPSGEVKIPGATMLNGIALGPDGRVYVTDTGMKPSGEEGMQPSGTDAVYAIDKNKKLTTIAKGKALGHPNGVLPVTNKTWVVSGSGELYSLDAKGKKGGVQKLPKGSLDGVLMLPGGDLLVSSWDAAAVYRGDPGGKFTPVIEGTKSPAGIGYDTKRARVVVPLFQVDEIRAYALP